MAVWCCQRLFEWVCGWRSRREGAAVLITNIVTVLKMYQSASTKAWKMGSVAIIMWGFLGTDRALGCRGIWLTMTTTKSKEYADLLTYCVNITCWANNSLLPQPGNHWHFLCWWGRGVWGWRGGGDEGERRRGGGRRGGRKKEAWAGAQLEVKHVEQIQS